MRPSLLLILTSAVSFVISSQGAAASSKPPACDLPPGLQVSVSKQYPGFRLLQIDDLDDYDQKLFRKDHGARCPGVTKVNFYGDAKPTWALVLASGRSPHAKSELVVAHFSAKGWELYPLDSVDETAVTWRESAGKYEGLDKTIRAANPVIIFCGYGSWAIVYAWNGKSVDKAWLSD